MNHNILQKHIQQIKKAKRSVHNRTINEIVQRLYKSGGYDVIKTNMEYRLPHNTNPIGEVDAYAIKRGKQNYLLFFEVKSNNSIANKRYAIEQLNRHETILGDNADRVFKFYVTPNKIEWIHRSHPTKSYHYLRP